MLSKSISKVFSTNLKQIIVLVMLFSLFVLSINVVWYTGYTSPLIGLSESLCNLSIYLDPGLKNEVDVIEINGRYLFAGQPGLSMLLAIPLCLFRSVVANKLFLGGIVLSFITVFAIYTSYRITCLYNLNRFGLFSSVAIALAGPLWVYSTHLFPQAALALSLGLMMYSLLIIVRNSNVNPLWLILAGFSSGFSILLDPSMISSLLIIDLVVLIYLIQKVRRKSLNLITLIKYIILYIVGFSPLIIVLLIYNTLATGNPFIFTEQYFLSKKSIELYGFTTPFYLGLYIQLLDLRKGLLPLYPVMIIALMSLPLFLKELCKNLIEKLILLNILIVPALTYSMWYDPDGGLSYGPRFLVPLTIFLSPTLAYILEKHYRLRIVFALLMGYCIIENIIVTTTTPYPCAYEDLEPLENQFISCCIPHLLKGTRSSYLYQSVKNLVSEPYSTILTMVIKALFALVIVIIAIMASNKS